MKTRNLLIALSVTVLTSLNVLASDALLSPRAADHQGKTTVGFNADPDLVAGSLSTASPRSLDNQIKTVAGKSTGVTPSLVCARRMSGTPKMIDACTEMTVGSMSCCSDTASK